MVTGMASKKTESSDDGTTYGRIALRCSPEYLEWFLALVERAHLTQPLLIEHALREYAKKVEHPPPPPRL